MNLYTASYFSALSLAAAVALVPPEVAVACAPAPPHGSTVQIADESAIIVWDGASKTQHFIRRASFTSDARDFGFLVPTPEKPELAEAGDEAFTTLANLTAPKVITQPRPSGGGGCGCGSAGLKSADQAAMPGGVDVLDARRVAGYDAVVLKADDAGALAKWLKEHGYESSPALTEWVAPYVKAGWTISAFKIAREAPEAPAAGDSARTGKGDATPRAAVAGGVSTSAVRMTFHTERPFFPYREPKAEPTARPGGPAPRLLRVYFLTDGRVKGTLVPDGADWEQVASVNVVWANKLEGADREGVLKQLKLPAETPPGAWWLTEFEDHSSPRPGADDVYFTRDENQAPVERPPIVQYVAADLPGGVMCYALALYVLLPRLVRRWRRRARA
jgi:hypothetical protein